MTRTYTAAHGWYGEEERKMGAKLNSGDDAADQCERWIEGQCVTMWWTGHCWTSDPGEVKPLQNRAALLERGEYVGPKFGREKWRRERNAA